MLENYNAHNPNSGQSR